MNLSGNTILVTGGGSGIMWVCRSSRKTQIPQAETSA
jgi:hypothetical protein